MAALAAMAGAYAFKQQSVFLLPFLVVLACKRQLRWRDFLLLPAVYLVSIVPAAIAGRSIGDLLAIYVKQSRSFSDHLTLNAANVYQWLPDFASSELRDAALIWGAVVIGSAVVIAATKSWGPTDTHLVEVATASVLLVPFVLPQMHERYFYAADVFTIVLAFYRPETAVIALVVQLSSLFSYWPFLFNGVLVPLKFVALAQLLVIVVLFRSIAAWLAGEGRTFDTPPVRLT